MTNTQILARLRAAIGDTDANRPRRTNDTLFLILTDAQNFVNKVLELCRKEFELTLTSDQREYSLDSTFVAFPQDRMSQEAGCVYWDTGNLKPTSPEAMDAERPGWRDEDSGTPSLFYLQQLQPTAGASLAKIGIVSAPSADFISDVPALTYYGVYRPAAMAANANLPFDNNPIFQDQHHRLIILYATWIVDLEDGKLTEADVRAQRWQALQQELDKANESTPGRTKRQGGFQFSRNWRSS